MKQAINLFILSLVILSCNNNGESTSVKDSTTVTDSHQVHNGNMAVSEKAEAVISAVYPDTAVTGSAKFTREADGKISLQLDLTIAAKAGKEVAVHIHEHGDCGDKGMLAHGHWNPTKEDHGKWGQGNFHSGDIGNVMLDKDGKGSVSISTDRWTIGGDSTKNIKGRAIIVHGGTDDYKTQPTGNAGNRIGCGIIQ